MITHIELLDLGFTYEKDIFSSKSLWFLGEEEYDMFSNLHKIRIMSYNEESQICHIVRGEFTVISRKCETYNEVCEFIKSVSFLFKLKL